MLGAASQQVTLSGSTIWAEETHLPLRNAPVIEPRMLEPDPGLTTRTRSRPRSARPSCGGTGARASEGDFAVSLPLPRGSTTPSSPRWPTASWQFARRHLPRDRPLVLVIEEDYAQVLGQTIKQKSPELPLIVVDQIQLGEGDFIDIGEPLFDGRVVPVSVKTLVFYQANRERNTTRELTMGREDQGVT